MVKFECPECGAVFWSGAAESSRAEAKSSWSPATVGTFEAAIGAGMEAKDVEFFERRRPAQSPDMHGHFVTPFLQAIATGLAVFVIAAVISIVWSLSFWLPFVAGPIVFAGAWFALLGFYNRLLIDHEILRPRVPAPAAGPIPQLQVDIRDREDGHDHIQIAELPVDVDRFGTLARAVAGGQELTFARWTGRGKLLTRGELSSLHDWLVRTGLAYWRNADRHQDGLEFSAGGRRFWARLAAGEFDVQ